MDEKTTALVTKLREVVENLKMHPGITVHSAKMEEPCGTGFFAYCGEVDVSWETAELDLRPCDRKDSGSIRIVDETNGSEMGLDFLDWLELAIECRGFHGWQSMLSAETPSKDRTRFLTVPKSSLNFDTPRLNFVFSDSRVVRSKLIILVETKKF